MDQVIALLNRRCALPRVRHDRGVVGGERSMIVSRVNAGLKRACASGKTLGRSKIAAGTEASIRKALAKGDRGILKIAAEFGVGSGTVQRIKAAL
jgi:DNA invertase Pin-like site-specific DNA recombinase